MQWLTVRSNDCEAVADALIRPALYLDLRAGHVLELVRTYAVHQCSGSKRSLSLISQRKPHFYGIFRRLTFLSPFNIMLYGLTEELWVHARIIDNVAPNDEVRIVLKNAMDVYQKEVLGINNVSGIERVIEYGAWADLKRALISKDEEDEIRSARRRREWREVHDRVKRISLNYSTRM
jgi:hypothetical protein